MKQVTFQIVDHHDGRLTLIIGEQAEYCRTYTDPTDVATDLLAAQIDDKPYTAKIGKRITEAALVGATVYPGDGDLWANPPTEGPVAQFLDEYMQRLMTMSNFIG